MQEIKETRGVRTIPWRSQDDPWVRTIPWRRKWKPTPVFLPGKSHRQRSLVSYNLWGHKELDKIEQLSTPVIRWTWGPRAKPLWERSCHALLWFCQPAHKSKMPFTCLSLLERHSSSVSASPLPSTCIIGGRWWIVSEWVNEWIYSYLKTKSQLGLTVLLTFNVLFLSVNMDHQAWLYNWHLL